MSDCSNACAFALPVKRRVADFADFSEIVARHYQRAWDACAFALPVKRRVADFSEIVAGHYQRAWDACAFGCRLNETVPMNDLVPEHDQVTKRVDS